MTSSLFTSKGVFDAQLRERPEIHARNPVNQTGKLEEIEKKMANVCFVYMPESDILALEKKLGRLVFVL